MADHFSQQALRVVIAQLCQSVGWNAIQTSSSDVLVELLERYLLKLGRKATLYGNHANRTEPNLVDVFHVFEDLGVSLPELLEYFTEMEVEAGSDPAVPLFPVHKPQSHVHSGLGVRLLRKAMGSTGTRLPSVGRKEGGSAGEGEGEDVDEDGEEGEVWEEIPGYLPPLPKAKEENDIGDDNESGIHISEGEATPVSLKSPLGQSGLPTIFRQRSQSISEEETGSRGSSVSDETLPVPPSRTTGSSILLFKNEGVSEKPVQTLDPQTGPQSNPSVSATQTHAHSRESPAPMLVDDLPTTQESKPVASGMTLPTSSMPQPRHTTRPKPNLRINTGIGMATSSKEEPGFRRQGSPCDQPRLPTLRRLSPMGAKGTFYSSHTPTLSPLLGTPPTSPLVSIATRPVLHPLVGSPVGFTGKFPSQTSYVPSPMQSGPPGTVPMEEGAEESTERTSPSSDVTPHLGNETGEPLATCMKRPESVAGEISTPSDSEEEQPPSSMPGQAFSSPQSSSHLSPVPPSPSAHGEPSPSEPTSPQPHSPSPSLHSLSPSLHSPSPSLHSPSPSQLSPSSLVSPSPSPLPSSQPTPSPPHISHSPPSGGQSSSPSPQPYPSKSPSHLGATESTSNSSPSSQGLSSPSPSPVPQQPSDTVVSSSLIAPLGEISIYSSPCEPSPMQALSPSSSSSSSATSSSSVASSSLAASDAEAELPTYKQGSPLASPSNKLPALLLPQQRLATPPSPSQLPCPPTNSLTLAPLLSRQETKSPATHQHSQEYLSSGSSELSDSDSSIALSPVVPVIGKRKPLPPTTPSTVPHLSSQVPRLPASQVPRLPTSQVPRLTTSQVPRLPTSQVPRLPPSRVPRLPPSRVPRLHPSAQAKKKRRTSKAKKIREPQKKKENSVVTGKKKIQPHLIVRINKRMFKKTKSVRPPPASLEGQSPAKRPPPTPSGNMQVTPIQARDVASIFSSTPSRKKASAVASATKKTPPTPLVVNIRRSLLPGRNGVGTSQQRTKGRMKMSIPKVALETGRTSLASSVPRGRGYKRELELSELGLSTTEPQSKKTRLAAVPPQPLTLPPQPTSSSSTSSDSSNESSSDSEVSAASPTPPPAPNSHLVLPCPGKGPRSPLSSSDNESVGSRGRLKLKLKIPRPAAVPEYRAVKTEPTVPRRTSTRTRPAPAVPPSRGSKSSAPSRKIKSQQRSAPSQQSLRSSQKQQTMKGQGRPLPGPCAKAPPPPTIVTISSTFTTAPPVSEGPEVCICPACKGPDDGTPMICCDNCDIWRHLVCVGLAAPPPEDQPWFCSNCQHHKRKRRRKH